MTANVICFEPGIARREGQASRFVFNKSTTLRAVMGDNKPCVCYDGDPHEILCLNDQGGSVMDVAEKAATLRAQEHGHQPIVCFSIER